MLKIVWKRMVIFTSITLSFLSLSACGKSDEDVAKEFEEKISSAITDMNYENRQEIIDLNDEYLSLDTDVQELITNYDGLKTATDGITNYDNGVEAYNNAKYDECITYMEQSSLFDYDSYVLVSNIGSKLENDLYFSMDEIADLSSLVNTGFSPSVELTENNQIAQLVDLQSHKGLYESEPYMHNQTYAGYTLMSYEVNAYISIDEDGILCDAYATDIDWEVTKDSLGRNQSNYISRINYQDNGLYKANVSFEDIFGEIVSFSFEFHFDEDNLIVDTLETSEDEGLTTITTGNYTCIESY